MIIIIINITNIIILLWSIMNICNDIISTLDNDAHTRSARDYQNY